MTNAITILPERGKALSRNNGGQATAKLAATGLAFVRQRLSDDVVEHFQIAASCGDEISRGPIDWISRLQAHAPLEYIMRAKECYRIKLPHAARVANAANFLAAALHPSDPIDRDQVHAMLNFLFALAPGKRDADERMLKIIAITDMFNETNNAIAEVTGLWRPVPQSPLLLALAIKQLQAEQVFEPSEAEIRKALGNASRRSRRLLRDVNEWLQLLRDSDRTMFETDRDGWREAHAAVDADATGVLLLSGAADDSPHRDALRALLAEKYQLEMLQEETPKQIAAVCRDVAAIDNPPAGGNRARNSRAKPIADEAAIQKGPMNQGDAPPPKADSHALRRR